MVGHTIGLGDRHPSNLLIDRVSGGVVHIDFGDCFETAMKRERYPEAVPFRLTRMLVQAMELGAPEGTFRIAAEHTMRVLREHDKSLMALLEAFLWEPLLQSVSSVPSLALTRPSWRLLETHAPDSTTSSSTTSPARTHSGYTASPPLVERESRRAHPHREDDAIALDRAAVEVLERVQQKLQGRDFDPETVLNVQQQVGKLIAMARNHSHLAISWLGWCPTW